MLSVLRNMPRSEDKMGNKNEPDFCPQWKLNVVIVLTTLM